MISRRNILKAIGIGGLMPFVKHEEVEAAPLPEVPAPQTQPLPMTVGSALFAPSGAIAVSGTASFWIDRDVMANQYALGRNQLGYSYMGFGGDTTRAQVSYAETGDFDDDDDDGGDE